MGLLTLRCSGSAGQRPRKSLTLCCLPLIDSVLTVPLSARFSSIHGSIRGRMDRHWWILVPTNPSPTSGTTLSSPTLDVASTVLLKLGRMLVWIRHHLCVSLLTMMHWFLLVWLLSRLSVMIASSRLCQPLLMAPILRALFSWDNILFSRPVWGCEGYHSQDVSYCSCQ